MVKIDKEIDAFMSGLGSGDLLLIHGNGSLGISEILKKIVTGSSASGNKIACFSPGNIACVTSYIQKSDYDPKNVAFYTAGSRDLDGFEIARSHSISKIKKELVEQYMHDTVFDLVIIEQVNMLDDFIFDRDYMFSVTSFIRKRFEKYPACVIATIDSGENGRYEDSLMWQKESERSLYFDVRDNVDFLMFINDRYDPDNEDECWPYKLDISLFDCRLKHLDLSYLYDAENHKLCKQQEKAHCLYNKALALGLSEVDAAAYAGFWNSKKDDDLDGLNPDGCEDFILMKGESDDKYNRNQ